jgi:hypothetical protein
LNFNDSIPIHVIFISFFFVLFSYSVNAHELVLGDLVIPSLIIVPASLFGFFILKLIIKDSVTAGLIITIGLILFFTYGHFYNIIKGVVILDEEIGRHRYMLPIFIFGYSLIIFYFLKMRFNLQKVSKIVNYFSLTILVMTCFNIATVSYEEPYSTYEFKINNEKTNELTPIYGKPNFYYIILDEYVGDIGEKYLNYDNSEFFQFLESNNFIIPNDSTSNYPQTHFSVPSSLSMNYVNFLKDELDTKSKSFLPLRSILYNSDVITNFKMLDYDIVIFESGFVPSENFKYVDTIKCKNNKTESVLLNVIGKSSMIGYFVERNEEQRIRDRVNCAFDELPKLANEISNPIFVFAHFLIPHGPFVFGPNGESIVPGNPISSEKWDEKIAYLDQLKFANKKMIKVVDKILEDDKNAIIIIQSDTGSGIDLDWQDPNDFGKSERLSILNVYHTPEITNEKIYDGITPVNSFRIIFNSYFNTEYEILDDKNYWSDGSNPYDLQDVTEIVNTIISKTD